MNLQKIHIDAYEKGGYYSYSSAVETVDIWKDSIKENYNILDIGCGAGQVWRKFDDVTVTGVDFVQTKEAENNLDLLIIHDISEGIGIFRNSQFDFALCVDVIEHLRLVDGVQLVSQLKRKAQHGFIQIACHGDVFDGVEMHRTIMGFDDWARVFPDAVRGFVRREKARITW